MSEWMLFYRADGKVQRIVVHAKSATEAIEQAEMVIGSNAEITKVVQQS